MKSKVRDLYIVERFFFFRWYKFKILRKNAYKEKMVIKAKQKKNKQTQQQ